LARAVCEGCLRPKSVCLCADMVHVTAPLELVIWQDPDESRHRLSTAPLLNLSIQNSRLVVGDCFEPQDLLGQHWQTDTLLLYPMEHQPACSHSQAQAMQRLLLLDGTWRKVKRLLLLNPWLQQLPHITLAPQEASRYAIRKSPRADGLSTLEAGVAAMNWLDQSEQYSPVLQVLDRMVALQQQHQGVRKHRR